MNTEKLIAFATAVGQDVKALQVALGEKITEDKLNTAIEQAQQALKTEILGDGVPEQFDTLKEIAEAIASISGGSVEEGIVAKIAELGSKIDSIEQLDLVAAYNEAKA